MKKWICMLVALMLALLGTAVLAEEIPLDADTYVSGLAAFGDEALVITNSYANYSVLHLKDGALTQVYSGVGLDYMSDYSKLDDEEKQVWDACITNAIPGDDGLYAFARYGRQLYKWDGAQLVKVGEPMDEELFWSQEGANPYIRSMDGCVTGGKLLAVLSGDESTDYCPILYSVDLSTGAGEKLEIDGIDYVQSIAPYKDGKALICYQDPENDYYMTIRSLDVAAGTISEDVAWTLGSYNASGMTYDVHSDTVYYFDEGCIYKNVPGAQPEIVAYPPTSYLGYAAMMNGQYLASIDGALCLLSVDGSALPEQTLRIQGGYMDEIQRGFLRENPTVGISRAEQWYGSSEEIATAIKTGETGIDIFSVSATGGLYAIINKGYALNLSDSQIIREVTDSYYPGFADALKDKNGDVYGVFNDAYMYSLPCINVEAWEELDLGEYPKTYSELIDLIAMWEEDYADDYPELTMYTIIEKSELINTILNAYILQYEHSPQGLRFDSPALREVLEKIEALPMESRLDWENMTDEDYEEINEKYNRTQIFSFNGDAFGENQTRSEYNDNGQITYTMHLLDPLVFVEGETPAASAYGEVYIVNPESPNKELAVKYLEYRASHLDDYARYMLTPTLTEPVRQENFEENVKQIEKSLASAQEAMEKADDVDKADYQDTIDFYETWLADKEKNQWRISQEAIDRYRELGDYVRIPSDSLFLSYDGDSAAMDQISEIVSRYTGGQLTLDAFLREMDQKINMIVLEGR